MQHAHLLQSNITEHDEKHRITWVYMCTYEKTLSRRKGNKLICGILI